MQRIVCVPGGRLRLIVSALLVVLLVAAQRTALAAPATITPASVWTDTSGAVIQAHGGGMIKVGSTYYWIGEDRANVTAIPAWTSGVYTPPFRNIKCYSSTDLVSWTFVGNLLTLQSTGDLGPDRVVERPKVIYNSSTGKYVLWVHIDSPQYSEAKVGVASSSSVCSGYTYHGSFRPLGQESRDMTLYKDSDGTAYVIFSSSGNSVLRIARLTADYLNAEAQVAITPRAGEAPAVFKQGGTYFLLASAATGWDANDNYYFTATSMAGPWTDRGDFTPGSSSTYDSQTTYVLPVQGTQTTTYMYMGDRWDDSSTTSFGNSRYIWLPLSVSGTALSMSYYDSWMIDAATGAWSNSSSGVTTIDDRVTGSGRNQFNYSGSGWQGCIACAAGAYNSSNSWSVIANDAVTVSFSGTQIRLYGVKDPSHGIGAVSINDGPETTVDFYAASRAGNQLVWTSPMLPQGEHSFRLRVTGSKNSSSSYGWVVPDRVDVIAGLTSVDDSVKGTGTNQFSYSGAWQTESSDVYGSGTYQGTNSYSNTANTSVTLSFSGTQISYYAVRDSGHGIAAVSIDNGPETSVDLYAASRAGNQLVWTSPTLAQGSHTFKIRVTGARQASSAGLYVTVDRVAIVP